MRAKISRLFSLLFLATSAVSAQGWTFVGNFPSKIVFATSSHTPSNATPDWRAWQKPVYDPMLGGLLSTLGNPNCCGGVYGNSVFLYQVGANSWQMLWSHTTSGRGGRQVITSISRSSGVVSVAVQNPMAWPFDPGILIAVGINFVSDPSFNVGPVLVTLVDQTHFTFPQSGPDATPACGTLPSGVANCGTAFGVIGTPDAPGDGHQYHAKAWDPIRNVLWIAFGTAAATVGAHGGYGTDTKNHDMYMLDQFGNWTQVCGDFAGLCRHPGDQESTLVYDPIADKLIMAGGLYSGTVSAQTWEYTPSTNTWTQICTDPPGRNACPIPRLDAPGLVYDPVLAESVLFGGRMPNGTLNTTTWLYNSATKTWTQALTTNNPPGTRFPVMDYVPRLGEIILIGAESTGGHVWAFDVDWHDLGIAPGPNLSLTASPQSEGAYDQTADRFVVFTNASSAKQIWSLQLP